MLVRHGGLLARLRRSTRRAGPAPAAELRFVRARTTEPNELESVDLGPSHAPANPTRVIAGGALVSDGRPSSCSSHTWLS